MESTFALKRRGVLAAAMLASLQGARAFAQQYPTKPVRVIVPWAAGGGTDVVFRKVAPALGERLGHAIVIDRRLGRTAGAAAMPAAVVARVHDAVDEVMATPAANSDLLKMFVQPVRMSQPDYPSFILSEYDRWGHVIREAKLSVES